MTAAFLFTGIAVSKTNTVTAFISFGFSNVDVSWDQCERD